MAEIVDGIEIGSNEATDTCQTLTERTHDDIHIIGQTEVVADSSSLTTEDTEAVCLIDHHRSVVLMLQSDDFRQVTDVAFHGEHTIDNDEFDRLGITLLQLFLQVFHVIVAILELLGK